MRNKPYDVGVLCDLCGKELFAHTFKVHEHQPKPQPAPQKCGVVGCEQPEAAIGLCVEHLDDMARADEYQRDSEAYDRFMEENREN